jgi:ABC-type sugar transport system ATPase subunit
MLGRELEPPRRNRRDRARTRTATTSSRRREHFRAAPHGSHPLTLDIYSGEVVGLAGLLGSGRTEFARLLFGADKPTSGQISVDGKPARLRTARRDRAQVRLHLGEPQR